MRPRVIPVMLLQEEGLIKTKAFGDPTYLGDPLNALRLYNEMEVDEVIVLDINATKEDRGPNFDYLIELASESFMPLTYGGGVTNLDQMEKLYRMGFEKVCLNSSFIRNPELLKQASKRFGAQSVVVAIDVKKALLAGYRVYDHVREKTTKLSVEQAVTQAIEVGAGEILVNAVDQDGMMSGYDIRLIEKLATLSVPFPLVCCGGAGKLEDLSSAHGAGADALAAGSIFVYKGESKGILINYPSQSELDRVFS